MTPRDVLFILIGMTIPYVVGALLTKLGNMQKQYLRNKTLTHEWRGQMVTKQVYEDLQSAAQDVRNATRDRDIIWSEKIPHDKVGYCQYEMREELGNYWCVNHKSESRFIVYVGSLLPCRKKEEI